MPLLTESTAEWNGAGLHERIIMQFLKSPVQLLTPQSSIPTKSCSCWWPCSMWCSNWNHQWIAY